jgi:hypothetical protein
VCGGVFGKVGGVRRIGRRDGVGARCGWWRGGQCSGGGGVVAGCVGGVVVWGGRGCKVLVVRVRGVGRVGVLWWGGMV